MEHHTGATIFGASSHGKLRTLVDAVTATPPPATIRPRNIWVVVDATVDQADLPVNRALESGLTTRAFGLWMAFRGMHPKDALHIVKQESHRYTYCNGRVDTHAKHQNTKPHPRTRTRATRHPTLQPPAALTPIPSATQPPHRIAEDTRYTNGGKRYHYPTPIQQLATTLGHPANTELLRRLKDSVRTPLYYSALRPDSLPAHVQKPRFQLALEPLPLLTRYHRWYASRSIQVPAGYTKCICGHAEEETWDHFKTCPLYRGLDTLTDWNPTHTIAQHARWPTRSPTTQQLATILKQTEVLEAVRRGLVPTAVYTLLRTHAEDPQGHGSAHAKDRRCQDSGAAHIPHPQLPAACSHPAPNGPSPPLQTPVLPAVRTCPTTYHPAWDPHHTCTPSTSHTTCRAGTSTTDTTNTPASMRAPPAPMPPGHRPCTGTANRQPPRAPSVCSNGYHRRPYPATLRPLGLFRSRTPPHPLPLLRGPQPPTPRASGSPSRTPTPANPASSGHSPTPSGTTSEGITWRTQQTTPGP